ncbi:MAG: N-acetyl sugar amidotransferase, partial [Alphaproteobacteria bacterium]|nr:N-acetyl sugar amidotransferase [Alphaproteobacteria bacterium]
LEQFRRGDGRYDCIVSGSGGKDSMMTSHLLKYRYGMNPLSVTYAPLLYSDIGWRNMQNWINVGGFDNVLFSPNGRVSGLLAREAFDNLFHPIQPFKFGLKQFAVKMALRFGIDLVMYGEPWTEYGSATLTAVDSPAFDASFYINDSPDLYISGVHVDALQRKHDLRPNDLWQYLPLRSAELGDRRITIETLGWYVKWDPQQAYYHAVDNCGFESDTQRTDGTYGKYSSIDDKFESLHYYCHFIKFGIGRTRFDASQEIRNGHITREEGIALAKQFEGEFPQRFHQDCLDFMGLTPEQFEHRTDEARSPHLWKRIDGRWVLWQDLPTLLRHHVEGLDPAAVAAAGIRP